MQARLTSTELNLYCQNADYVCVKNHQDLKFIIYCFRGVFTKKEKRLKIFHGFVLCSATKCCKGNYKIPLWTLMG